MSKEMSTILSHNLKQVVLTTNKASALFWKDNTDERLLGKHFRVTSSLDPLKSRHYTICDTMTPHKYTNLCNALKQGQLFDKNLYAEEPTNEIRFTIKNYNLPEGLSTKFFGDN